MLTVKKRLITLGLLLLVAMPLFFSAFTYLQQKLIQHQRNNRFKTEFLETVTIEAEKVNWLEDDDEILVNGRLFDVESFKVSGTAMIFTGFFDSEEERLVKHINEVEEKKDSAGSPLQQSAIKFLFLPNYKETATFLIQNNWQTISNWFSEYTESTYDMSYPAIAPLPNIVSNY